MPMIRDRILFPMILALSALSATWSSTARASYALEHVRGYDFPSAMVAASDAERVVWLSVDRGRRNVWAAQAPGFVPRRLTGYSEDDGQDISSLRISGDGRTVIYVRGGEHGSNWDTDKPVNPNSLPEAPKVQVWSIAFAGGEPRLLGDGDAPVLSPDGRRVAFLADGEVRIVSTAGRRSPERLRVAGKIGSLRWSPDGRRLALVVDRDTHAMIGIFRDAATPLTWVAPDVARDALPRWSPDGTQLLFVRTTADRPSSYSVPRPWSIWVADAGSGRAERRWASGDTLRDSLPANLSTMFDWAADGTIVFLSYRNGWQQLYSLASGNDEPLLLSAGEFQVEDATLDADRRHVIYSANAGDDPDDAERRHLFRVAVDRADPVALTAGAGSEWSPAITPSGEVLFFSATARRPPLPTRIGPSGGLHLLDNVRQDFPMDALVEPRRVSFAAEDGLQIHGQLFMPQGDAQDGPYPAVVFVHGGPQRQMLLTWHNRSYYANAYAINQYLASRGIAVLSVNYRLGPFYGHDFHYPENAGAKGASEYQDIRSAGRFLQTLDGIDPQRIGIYGGSYGGYLTAMALARDSGLFKVGVDVHGVHDWTAPEYADRYHPRYPADRDASESERAVAWRASPVSDVEHWRSPVLLIHGDDDRNVPFGQFASLVHRLRAIGVPHETVVVVDDTHHMMLYENELRVNNAITEFLLRHLNNKSATGP